MACRINNLKGLFAHLANCLGSLVWSQSSGFFHDHFLHKKLTFTLSILRRV
jgi:hypothetical protein